MAELPHVSPVLQGVTIVLEGAGADAAALEALALAGAQPGLVVPLHAAPVPHDLLERAGVLVVTDLRFDTEGVFALRTFSTAVRARHPEVRILARADALPASASAYVDGLVDGGPRLVSATAPELTALSHAGGARPVLVRLDTVRWTAVITFASRRAFSAGVVAEAALTVEEVVARHQARRRREEAAVQRTIARGTTSLLFEVPGFVAPVAVTAETTVYRRPGLTEVEQRNVRVNGAAVAGGSASSPPALPLIEPERVATPPLVITLDDAYRYVLEGASDADGTEAYVVRFDGEAARGRAWIDAATFALRRLETVQRQLRGPIVASEQHERFAAFQADGQEVSLPVRTQVFQAYEGAGHRTPIHRTIDTPHYEINPPDFEKRLQAAHASSHVMLRDTPQGFRYLLRPPRAAEGAAREVAPRAGERIRTAVAGVLVDPNITVPLPFAGFSYVDLNLLDTGAQLNLFFGGAYGQLSWSIPSLGGTGWQAYGRAFAIAAHYNDRSFRGGAEQYHENIRQRPAQAAAGLLRQISPRIRARASYELDYTAFDPADTTAPGFAIPADALVHGLLIALDGDAGPWSLRLWANPAVRHHWRAWGDASAEDAADARTFARYGASVTRTVALRPRLSSRVELAFASGTDLDRFSRYTFDAFENRLRGYPTASIRYDRGAVARSVTSFSGGGWRVDGFADVAAVRDPGFGPGLRGYPGLGAALETGGPFRTLVSAEWGYGFRARRGDGGTGTHALRVTVYRTF